MSKISDHSKKIKPRLKFSLWLIALAGTTYTINKYLVNNHPQFVRKIYFDKFFNYNHLNQNSELDGGEKKVSSQYVKLHLFLHIEK